MSETDATPSPSSDRAAEARQRAALESVVSERILDGSLRDAHGEIDMDPDATDAAAQHRDHADAVEAPTGPASDETLGTTEPDHPRSRRAEERGQ